MTRFLRHQNNQKSKRKRLNMAKIHTCKDCKWWESKNKEKFGDCKCAKIDISNDNDKGIDKDGAAATCCDDGYGTEFLTGPDFGCIHWEGKQ